MIAITEFFIFNSRMMIIQTGKIETGKESTQLKAYLKDSSKLNFIEMNDCV